jgi:hypothetical protein
LSDLALTRNELVLTKPLDSIPLRRGQSYFLAFLLVLAGVLAWIFSADIFAAINGFEPRAGQLAATRSVLVSGGIIVAFLLMAPLLKKWRRQVWRDAVQPEIAAELAKMRGQELPLKHITQVGGTYFLYFAWGNRTMATAGSERDIPTWTPQRGRYNHSVEFLTSTFKWPSLTGARKGDTIAIPLEWGSQFVIRGSARSLPASWPRDAHFLTIRYAENS